MVTRQINIIDVQERSDFDELIEQLQAFSSGAVTVDLDDDVDVLTDPSEFELLHNAIRSRDIHLELATDDPVRQELARIFGIAVITGPDPRLSISPRPWTDRRTLKAPVEGLTNVVKLPPTQEFAVVDDGSRFSGGISRCTGSADTDASFSFVLSPPMEKMSVNSGTADIPARKKSKPRPLGRSIGASSILIAVLAVVVAIATLIVAILAPSAQVVIVPESRSVESRIVYGLVGTGADLDVEIQPTQITESILIEATAPATGEQMVPDQSARGMMFLTNSRTEIATLPAGTVFSSPATEVRYISIEEISIPAADPFLSAQFGTAVVGVEAALPGPEGNIDAGLITGEHESGILFQNRFPIEGGTLRPVQMATEKDIEAAKIAAQRQVEDRVNAALDSRVPGGWRFSSPPAIVGDTVETASVVAGATAEEITYQIRIQVGGAIYDPQALEDSARNALLTGLTSGVPEGFGLVVESIKISSPQQVNSLQPSTFAITAAGTVQAQFDETFRRDLVDDLVGKGESYAVEKLETVSGIDQVTVTYGPDWLPWNPVPRLENRVSVEINGS